MLAVYKFEEFSFNFAAVGYEADLILFAVEGFYFERTPLIDAVASVRLRGVYICDKGKRHGIFAV